MDDYQSSQDIDGYKDEDWSDGLEGGTFVSFKDPVCLEFMENTPTKRKNKWNKDVWDWEVMTVDESGHEIDRLVLSTASARLRRKLGKFKPLLHKRFRISRTGEGMSTEYSVVEITTEGDTKLV